VTTATSLLKDVVKCTKTADDTGTQSSKRKMWEQDYRICYAFLQVAGRDILGCEDTFQPIS